MLVLNYEILALVLFPLSVSLVSCFPIHYGAALLLARHARCPTDLKMP